MQKSIYGDSLLVGEKIVSESWSASYCVTCIVHEFGTRSALTRFLFGEHPRNHYLLHRLLGGEPHASCAGHEVATITGKTTRGLAHDVVVRALLRSSAGDQPVVPARFDGRQPPSAEIEEAAAGLRPMLGDRLDEVVSGFTYKRYPGAAPVRRTQGDRGRVRRLVKELSPRWHDADFSNRKKGLQRSVTYHDGLPPLRSLLLKATVEDLRLFSSGEAYDEQDRLSLHWTGLLDRYSEVSGQLVLRDRVLEVLSTGEFARTLDGLREAVGEDLAAAFTLLAGDLAVLQFRSAKQAWLLPEVRTLAELCDALQRFGYRRLDRQRDPHNDSRRLDLAVKDMANDLVVLEFHEIDWRPLLAATKFTHVKN